MSRRWSMFSKVFGVKSLTELLTLPIEELIRP